MDRELHGNLSFLIFQKGSVRTVKVLSGKTHPERSAVNQHTRTKVEVLGTFNGSGNRVYRWHISIGIERKLVTEYQFIIIDTPETHTEIKTGREHYLAIEVDLIRILKVYDRRPQIRRSCPVGNDHESQSAVQVREIVIITEGIRDKPVGHAGPLIPVIGDQSVVGSRTRKSRIEVERRSVILRELRILRKGSPVQKQQQYRIPSLHHYRSRLISPIRVTVWPSENFACIL